MRINGQDVPYSEWSNDPIIREWAMGHIDTPFISNMSEEDSPAEGTPVVGYRAFYNIDDRYYSIYKTLGQGNIKYGLMNGQDYNNPQHRFESPYPSFRPAVSLEAGVPNTHSIGFFYFPDRAMSEDYLKVFIMQELEKSRFPTQYIRKGNNFYFPRTPTEVKDYQEKFQAGLQEAPRGRYTLNKVSGIATKNEIRDNFAGFTMQEMVIDPQAILTIEQNEPWESLHGEVPKLK